MASPRQNNRQESVFMSNFVVLDHPLASHHTAILRDKNTPSQMFRTTANKLTQLLLVEATRDLNLKETSIETPLTGMKAQKLAQRLAIVPILRAGLGMVDPVLDMMPQAEVWHLGLYRNEETLEPVIYYNKLPEDDPADVVIVVDPMLATGGSASATLQVVKKWGVPKVKLMSLIAAPEGVKRIQAEFPECQVYLAALDEHLNDKAYIVPGLGDAGDRIFNTVK